MTVTIQLPADAYVCLQKYAEEQHLSLEECIRQILLERMEDEQDLKIFEEAIAEYEKNPVTYSFEEVKQMLDD